ncbi:hypothetical protein GGTG_07556 [Gaeumannomyces tritici R3-111a-1]|uniref:Uncharacterized protein n=1 Tax=Gaeumannomyces tritici (strain R3-111a-1) TaxID=644352 RepID=J3P208_GAET3|nr:hypothetical protein GGTG_07556 [Gaeumannomyces tritici R3-111a-1]EJT73700.1 hypothetical protein GGTG_07556 [Gaeumannomyces tritici R3-111a-1]
MTRFAEGLGRLQSTQVGNHWGILGVVESAKMAAVYGNAWLTLAAVHSRDGEWR